MRITPSRLALVCGLTWAALFLAARLLLEQPNVSLSARLLLAFGPTLPLLGFMAGAVAMSRLVDEMERRVQLEAFASAFSCTILLIATLALAQRAGFAKFEDFSYAHLLPMLFMLYLGGLILARRRYACAPE
jgi:peptidoglycan/LPS O-acetylase OafA/YrhL